MNLDSKECGLQDNANPDNFRKDEYFPNWLRKPAFTTRICFALLTIAPSVIIAREVIIDLINPSLVSADTPVPVATRIPTSTLVPTRTPGAPSPTAIGTPRATLIPTETRQVIATTAFPKNTPTEIIMPTATNTSLVAQATSIFSVETPTPTDTAISARTRTPTPYVVETYPQREANGDLLTVTRYSDGHFTSEKLTPTNTALPIETPTLTPKPTSTLESTATLANTNTPEKTVVSISLTTPASSEKGPDLSIWLSGLGLTALSGIAFMKYYQKLSRRLFP